MNYEGFTPDNKDPDNENLDAKERHDEHFAKLLSDALKLEMEV